MERKDFFMVVLLVLVLIAQAFALDNAHKQKIADLETIHSLRDALDYSERVRARCQNDLERRPAKDHLVKFSGH